MDLSNLTELLEAMKKGRKIVPVKYNGTYFGRDVDSNGQDSFAACALGCAYIGTFGKDKDLYRYIRQNKDFSATDTITEKLKKAYPILKEKVGVSTDLWWFIVDSNDMDGLSVDEIITKVKTALGVKDELE